MSLNDIESPIGKKDYVDRMFNMGFINAKNQIKSIAIKWVKEDFEDLIYNKRTPEEIIRIWMCRLDVTGEDLK